MAHVLSVGCALGFWALACSDRGGLKPTLEQPGTDAFTDPIADSPTIPRSPIGSRDLQAQLPAVAGEFAPAYVALSVPGDDASAKALTGSLLAEDQSCASCHPDVYAQQQASAHAWSSFSNPIYRASVETLRREVGHTASKMCAGCHDIALLIDGAMAEAVSPTDARAHAGVTCRTCHGIRSVSTDGNGSFTLSSVVLPRPADSQSVLDHKRSVAPIRTNGMCGSCHRGFLSRATGNDHFLPGLDELGDHARSAYSGPGLSRVDSVEPKTCIQCHMKKVPASDAEVASKNGQISSHRFAGGHTWLAAMLGDTAQLAAQRSMLKGAATIDITGARVTRVTPAIHIKKSVWSLPATEAVIEPGNEVVLDIVIRNTGVGHRFPGGVLDGQDTFVVVEVVGQDGTLYASAGLGHETRRTRSLKHHLNADTHSLRSLIAGDDGELHTERDVHHFAATVVNHTIAARDAAVVRYSFMVPKQHRGPLTLRARLVHRTRNQAIAKLACAVTKSPSGRRYRAFALELGKPVLDPCAPLPTTVIGRAAITIGGVRTKVVEQPLEVAARLYELGMALSRSVSERLGEALIPLNKALLVLGDDSKHARRRASVMAMMAVVLGRQGRSEEANSWIDKAESLVGRTPGLAQIRGDVAAIVWQWEAAASAYQRATNGAPQNPSGWRSLAMARGSLGEHRAALVAAKTGLKLSPRDPDMLRVQALSLRALAGASKLADSALSAYDAHRRPDRAGDIRLRCAQRALECARERQPTHMHPMKQHIK